jgi:tRNA threonylcarbamoyladenosine biosynthesis protein TsaB
MILLAIDSSSNAGSISLMKDEKVIFLHYTDIQVTHSERLMPQVEQACKEHQILPEMIDAVLLSNGPGSFTGIRIGLATAKGICVAHQIPLIPYNTLEMNAVNAMNRSKIILSIIDARMNEIYFALYSDDLQEIVTPKNASIETLITELKEQNIDDVIVCGDYVEGLLDELINKDIRYSILNSASNLFLSTNLFTLHQIRNTIVEWDMLNVSTLEPFYIRSSIAQINRKQESK